MFENVVRIKSGVLIGSYHGTCKMQLVRHHAPDLEG